MAKLTDKFFNRVIEGKLVADSGDELPKELPAVSASDNGKALVVSGGKWQAGTISGGTKMYLHVFMDNASKTFSVMMASSTPITSSGTTFLNDLRLGAILGNQATTLLYLQYQGSNTLGGKTRNNSDFTFNTENYTDTVTEL